MKSRDDYAGEVVTRLHPGEGKIRRKACFHYGSFPDDAPSAFQAILNIIVSVPGCAIWFESTSHAHRDNDHGGQ
jgi:hypothetical protein